MKTLRITLCLALTAVAIVFLPGRAFACSCIAPPEYEAAVADADAVFSGTLVGTHDAEDGANIQSSIDPIQYEFEVDAVAKGEVEPHQVIFSARDSASCGYGFTTNKRYLVFAYKIRNANMSGAPVGSLETNLCTRTEQLGPNQQLPIDAEPMGGAPEEAPAPGIPTIPSLPDDGTDWMPLMLALAGAAALAGSAAVLLSRR